MKISKEKLKQLIKDGPVPAIFSKITEEEIKFRLEEEIKFRLSVCEAINNDELEIEGNNKGEWIKFDLNDDSIYPPWIR